MEEWNKELQKVDEREFFIASSDNKREIDVSIIYDLLNLTLNSRAI